jgi:hypothetical protein
MKNYMLETENLEGLIFALFWLGELLSISRALVKDKKED